MGKCLYAPHSNRCAAYRRRRLRGHCYCNCGGVKCEWYCTIHPNTRMRAQKKTHEEEMWNIEKCTRREYTQTQTHVHMSHLWVECNVCEWMSECEGIEFIGLVHLFIAKTSRMPLMTSLWYLTTWNAMSVIVCERTALCARIHKFNSILVIRCLCVSVALQPRVSCLTITATTSSAY